VWNSKFGLIKLIDFRKVNAEAKEIQGQKVYVYDFISAWELPDGLAWRDSGGEPGFWKDFGPGDRNNFLGHFVPLPKGTTAVRRGTITFRYTENGWVSGKVPDNWTDNYCTDLKPDACYTKVGWDKN